MAQVITMPKLSDTMTVGTLVKWLKKEGDAVKFGEILAEIQTDKATMEFEAFGDGTILKIYAPADSHPDPHSFGYLDGHTDKHLSRRQRQPDVWTRS